MTIRLRTLLIAIAVLLALAGVGGWLFVHLGLYNVAATVQHTAPVYRLLDYAMYRSVKAHADQVPPPGLDELRRIAAGAVLYRGHCVQCHGAPGVPPDPFAFGLTPAPVNLVPTARHWKPGEIFWMIKHGAKMTGMPAWQYRMSDEDIWNITAFVKSMALMSPLEYARLVRELPTHSHPTAAGPQAGPARSTEPYLPPTTGAAHPPVAGRLGNVAAGKQKIQAYLCITCHQIPGIVGANRHVGPPLNGIAGRVFIAGVITNTPENMIRFLRDPRSIDPLTAMPALGLSEQDARDIAAYLYTLDAP